MCFASTPHARQAGRRVCTADRSGARSPPQPCEGDLFYRRLRSKRGRIRAFPGSGFRARGVSGARALQSGNRRSERAGRDRPGAWPGNTDLDAGRTRMAECHDQRPGLRGVDTGGLLRNAARAWEQGPERDGGFRRGTSGVWGVRRLGQERALDRQLRGRAVQQPQQLRLRRRFRHRARGALVTAAGGATGRCFAR